MKAASKRCAKISCTTCYKDDCPYLYCHNVDCMACNNRMDCPRCRGNCRSCEFHDLCEIINNLRE